MANRYATKSGNWSDTTVWDGGTLPGVGDVVRPNGFTVTIDQDIQVDELRNNASAPAANGGSFVVSSIPGGGREIGATSLIQATNSADTPVLNITATANQLTVVSASIIGSGSTTHAYTAAINGTATVVVNGGLFGGTGNNGHAIRILATNAMLTVNGNLTGGTNNNSAAVGVNAVSTVIINGNVSAAPSGSGPGIASSVAASITVNGTVSAGSAQPGISLSEAAVLDAHGEVIASNAAPGIRSTNAGAVIRVSKLRHAPNNRAPLVAESFMFHSAENAEWIVKDDSAFPSDGADVHIARWHDNTPAPENVRAGVTYAPDNSLTGSLVMPPPESVASGVAVGDTVGTAALTAETVWDHPTEAADTDGSMGKRLRNTATVASTGDQIAAAMSQE